MVNLQGLAAGIDAGERRRLGLFLSAIVAIHVAGWGALLTYGAGHPGFVALGGLAYTFGLRHAFDPDHIAAIDNSTRKLLQQGRRPVGVGFFFAVGHSTVVLALALGLGFAARAVLDGVVSGHGELRSVGGMIGTGISGMFLVLIAVLNLVILVDIARSYRRLQSGKVDRRALEAELIAGGLLSRVFGRLFGLVDQSWHLAPIGLVFGLGFDTASEVALLSISAGAAAQSLPFMAVVSLPIIFAAGMSLMDTADGVFMAKAYSWAFSNPVRKVLYNFTMTSLSVFVAFFIGALEISQILIQVLGLHGPPYDTIAGFKVVGLAGFAIVGAFIVTWALAFAAFKLLRVDERWGPRSEV
ncbi:MAG: HoxN/HupN/NixA family nickel/cobalt transporter [Candidatus Dormibacteraeota bacterium]|nr:HoxN/HupN/NixA family nickel/cobalt transporter [Candidatus Dormibacteraeota bacterium]